MLRGYSGKWEGGGIPEDHAKIHNETHGEGEKNRQRGEKSNSERPDREHLGSAAASPRFNGDRIQFKAQQKHKR